MTAKEILSNYRFYKDRIITLQQGLKQLEVNKDGLKAQTFNEKRVSKGITSSIVENQLLRKEQLEQELTNLDLIVKNVDRSVDLLNDTDKEIIKLRYLTKETYTWVQIGIEVGYSKEQCQRRAKNCLKQLDIAICGIYTMI